ncbi:hypothetical protein BJX65DRAFT_78817 [Aspergillus insuetus]
MAAILGSNGVRSVVFIARVSGGPPGYQYPRLKKTLKQTKLEYVAKYADMCGEPHSIKFIRSSLTLYRPRGRLEGGLAEFFNSAVPPMMHDVAIVINGLDGLTTNREAFVELLQEYVGIRNVTIRIYFAKGAIVLGQPVRWLEIDPALVINMIVSDSAALVGDAERFFLDKMDRI